eukprot:NODE_5808_length_635_cov_35.447099_g5412_i0.p3 GENE.NODE_5808_length_635_cov_35.447099_g5412_i0~~NODE_5808_length_635_cov_35.447099_g5412_i0.p3  ORF type:complete len:119 (+),score=31.76 NODE_5808_length_635_cov_35.447099_g5412_i0:160-516(+)
MSSLPNLVAIFSFNPPNIKILGPIEEDTIKVLNEAMPMACTTDPRGRKPPATFVFNDAPVAHWDIQLYGNYCDDVGQMQIMLCLFDALEQEGRWQLKATNALPMPEAQVYKFFFLRKQ